VRVSLFLGQAFAFFTLMMLIQAFVVWKLFQETKGKTLEKLGEEMSKYNFFHS